MSLTSGEISNLKRRIRRMPNAIELQIVAAEWSEHCSYKSSKIHLKELPSKGQAVLRGKGLDSGVLDVGDGYAVTVHIESHNHPSAIEPYGGAATGVGGVIRDILSAGTRPIAVLNGLRFGSIETDQHAKWLFRNAVLGIADYGNCLGIPTVGGEIEFDDSFANYALVDVAAVGFGKKRDLIKNRASPGDIIVIVGGPTGMDGVGGSQFASDSLEEEDRSAVQIPDPFIEKMTIEAVLEAGRRGVIRAMKDLGGGGLACAVSETADALSVGMDIDLSMLHLREPGMRPGDIMTSESQERMLIITTKDGLGVLEDVCRRYGVQHSAIGTVTKERAMCVRHDGSIIAKMPASVVANAPLLDRPSKRPEYLDSLPGDAAVKAPKDLSGVMLKLLGSPNISSKAWAYGQYDHEVGIRTAIKPGNDAAVLRLDNGKYLSVTIDGNPKHCYIDPRRGAAGCFEEACRNVACTGGRPIGMVDHMQFGSPEDPEIFWTFKESLRGISEFAEYAGIPCVGGKVSFYNETSQGPIKPSPVIGVLGLSRDALRPRAVREGDRLFVLGATHDELGGSEYLEYVHGIVGGRCPMVDPAASGLNMYCVLDLIEEGRLARVHDCSKGGLGVTACELCIDSGIGCSIDASLLPSDDITLHRLLFSESHSRYLMVASPDDAERVSHVLKSRGAAFGMAGVFGGDSIEFSGGAEPVKVRVDKARDSWMKLGGSVGSG